MIGTVFFNFYGIRIKLTWTDPRLELIVHQLSEDLNFFIDQSEQTNHYGRIVFNLTLAIPPNLGAIKRFFLFRTKMCTVYGFGKTRICDYGNGTRTYCTRANKKINFNIQGAIDRIQEIYEVSLLALLSTVGEELDLIGYHRAHGLAIEYQGKGSLILLDSGGGKSSMAALLSKRNDIRILSDEMPLIKDGVIYPFPIRMTLKADVAQAIFGTTRQFRRYKRMIYPEKVLIPFNSTQIGSPCTIIRLLVENFQNFPSFVIGFQLFKNLVVGIGLCQMAEHMLRVDNIFRLVRIAYSRVREATRIYFSSEKIKFDVSPNAFENSMRLLSLLAKKDSR